LLAPIAIESDPSVAAARGVAATWQHYDALMVARDRVSRAKFGCSIVEWMHRLHGSAAGGSSGGGGSIDGGGSISGSGRPDDPSDGWRASDHLVGDDAIDRAWRSISVAAGVDGTVRIERASVRPRAFVVEPGIEVIVVVPPIVDTPAARFALLHELGHAVCALASRTAVPRVIDEAVASLVARRMEGDPTLEPVWSSPLAEAARRRRTAHAALLDRRERGDRSEALSPSVPWSLWHDPGAQATYVAAETVADRLRLGSIRADLSRERTRIDLATRL
jgi:hypothetical protein